MRSWDYMPTMPEIATGLLPVGLILLVLGGVWLLFGLIPGEEEEKVKA